MKMSIQYQKMTLEQIDKVVELRILQLRDEGAEETTDIRPQMKDFFQRHLFDGTYVSWLAMDGDRIVGTSGMSFTEKPPYFSNPLGRIGILSSMYTDPDYRRKGIARELLSRVVQEAKDYGCGVIHITASDMGVLLYQSFGFEKNGNFMQMKL